MDLLIESLKPLPIHYFAEAVNLELVNLNKTPTSNGHRDNGLSQKKKDTSQVEMGNSYNEYFVPVNEHKKYMRYYISVSILISVVQLSLV